MIRIDSLGTACTGCTACAMSCPISCIEMCEDEEGFLYPKIDNDRCISCGACVKVCHCIKSDDNIYSNGHIRESYYGLSEDMAVLNSSSSGGAFYHIAQAILKEDGVVYGAIFDCKTRMVRHTSTDTTPLALIQKSKYVESFIGDNFESVKKNMAIGRKVLFCGTPCQVSGLKNYLQSNTDHLLTCSFVCHGVPSRKIFMDYLSRYKQDIISLDFRDKIKGWKTLTLSIQFKKKKIYIPYNLDDYYCGFEKHPFLRKSCYKCQYIEQHNSDITIADFWGYSKIDSPGDISKGLSMMIANTEKGRDVIQKLTNFKCNRIDNAYTQYAFQVKDTSDWLREREEFFSAYHRYGFKKAARKTYMKGVWKKKIKYKIKKVLRREQ